MSKKALTERDICTQYITPALQTSGWVFATQVREEVTFTAGRIMVRGKLHSRGTKKRADYILYYKPNIPIALIEAKDNTHGLGVGMQQGLGYADTLDISFVFSYNGYSFLEHDPKLLFFWALVGKRIGDGNFSLRKIPSNHARHCRPYLQKGHHAVCVGWTDLDDSGFSLRLGGAG
jgi:hypothetical protein